MNVDMKQSIHLLIIDPQNDFCDLPQAWWPIDPLTRQARAPALPVQGAHADMQRLSGLIDAGRDRITDIIVTLDSHHRLDVAHPLFWVSADGSDVPPFTSITAQQVRDGLYRPRQSAVLPRVLGYLDELEARGRYILMVWPVHCEIGTWGHNVHAEVQAACNRWEEATWAAVKHVHKGSNPWTEHYSALQAEVPEADDPDTQLNRPLIAHLDQADTVLIAGEASSHCVRASTEHIADHLPSRRLDKIVLLTDCMSPVSGFESHAETFLAAMRERGVRLATTQEVLRWLQR